MPFGNIKELVIEAVWVVILCYLLHKCRTRHRQYKARI